MVNVDPETGKKSLDDQPLKGLFSFRRYKPEAGLDSDLAKERKRVLTGPLLAINCGIDSIGTVKVGDPVFILSK